MTDLDPWNDPTVLDLWKFSPLTNSEATMIIGMLIQQEYDWQDIDDDNEEIKDIYALTPRKGKKFIKGKVPLTSSQIIEFKPSFSL